jgi:hypothetical protein
MIDLHQSQWPAAPNSRGDSTIPEGKLIMSKDRQTDEKGHRVQEKADEKGHRPQRRQTSCRGPAGGFVSPLPPVANDHHGLHYSADYG